MFMSKIDDVEFDLEILRDVVYQIEQDIKALTAEVGRVKELLDATKRAADSVREIPKTRQH